FFFASRRRHTRFSRDWSSDVCSSDLFSNESTLGMRWPKYWSFSFSIIPSKEIPGLISFRMDWLDLLAVQGTLKSLLQHHSSKARSEERRVGKGCRYGMMDGRLIRRSM